ncbi:hypothetical protein DTL42_05125 [Bremerella cremea]|uniref:Uncharacterized protein n=1 Tax=Bremerella cremea TaxID=1031537 RepID=A0A368KY81_9BACT|nr:hypothetical protein DTL42_05125 [Bremerella cremea]
MGLFGQSLHLSRMKKVAVIAKVNAIPEIGMSFKMDDLNPRYRHTQQTRRIKWASEICHMGFTYHLRLFRGGGFKMSLI